MKLKLLSLILIALTMTSCTNAQQKIVPSKILIVYLSRTKNTQAVAQMIHNNTGGTLVELELKIPYPEN